jgi:hypothetical protein
MGAGEAVHLLKHAVAQRKTRIEQGARNLSKLVLSLERHSTRSEIRIQHGKPHDRQRHKRRERNQDLITQRRSHLTPVAKKSPPLAILLPEPIANGRARITCAAVFRKPPKNPPLRSGIVLRCKTGA